MFNKEKLIELYQRVYATVWIFALEHMQWYYSLRAKFRAIRPRMLSAIEKQWAIEKGETLDQMDRHLAVSQMRCTHRKGGSILRTWTKDKDGVEKETTTSESIAKCLYGGTSDQYSVMKHIMMNGDYRIRCTRCGKTWTAPIRNEFATEREFWQAIEEYEKAKGFLTNNATSTSLQFKWTRRDGSDASEVPRKMMAARV